MADTARMAEIRRDFPVTTGISADAKHEGRQANLVPFQGSFVRKAEKAGFSYD